MKKFLKKLVAIFVLFLISFAAIHADENLKLQNLNDSQKHESSSDDFLHLIQKQKISQRTKMVYTTGPEVSCLIRQVSFPKTSVLH